MLSGDRESSSAGRSELPSCLSCGMVAVSRVAAPGAMAFAVTP